jgi:hypothetical protein
MLDELNDRIGHELRVQKVAQQLLVGVVAHGFPVFFERWQDLWETAEKFVDQCEKRTQALMKERL